MHRIMELPEEERFSELQKVESNGQTMVENAINDPELLETLFKALPDKNRFSNLQSLTIKNKKLFDYVVADPSVYLPILNALNNKDDRLSFVNTIKDMVCCNHKNTFLMGPSITQTF